MGGFSKALVVALLLAAVGPIVAQDTEPDYSRKSVAEWIKALKDREDRKFAIVAFNALGPDGPYAKEAIPALIDALDEEESSRRSYVVETIVQHGPSVVPELLRALKKPQAYVRAGAVEGLGKVGRRSDKAAPALVAALEDNELSVRAAAMVALTRLGPKAEPAVPALIVALGDKDREVREWAVGTLAKVGPGARAAVPALLDAFKNEPTIEQRLAILDALSAMGPAAKKAVPMLARLLQESKESSEVGFAIDALGAIGPDARTAIPDLVKIAEDEEHDASFLAIVALARIGPDTKTAPILIKALRGGRRYGKGLAEVARALGSRGAESRDAVPALIVIARDLRQWDDVRKAAADAVCIIDPEIAAKEKIKFAYLDVRLGKLPEVKLAPRDELTQEKKQRIKVLIGKLADIKHPDFGMSMLNLEGEAFAPLPGQETLQGGLLTDQRIETSTAFRSLVEIGPDALPFLLQALDDKTPTQLKVGVPAMASFSTKIEGNPLSSVESQVIAKMGKRANDDLDAHPIIPYRLKVGDVCYVAIGQIVGRPYRAVRYVPTAMITVSSPVESEKLRDGVRAIWTSGEPAKRLLDSLLIDYATEGDLVEVSDRQVQAALRLLYYFPKEAAPVVATRLSALDVKGPEDDDWIRRDEKNCIRTIDFINAVSWCQSPEIQAALSDIAKRTDVKKIKEAASTSKK